MQVRASREEINLRDVSRETRDKLEEFFAALLKWNRSINLISKSSPDSDWERHIADSAQLWNYAVTSPSIWCDLGAGGGLPGIVVSIVGAQFFPSCRICLIESDKRKSAFLKIQTKALSLNAEVITARIEVAPPQAADVVSARALAPLRRLLHYALRHQGPDSTLVLPKSRNFLTEIEDARNEFDFTAEAYANVIDPNGVILVLKKLRLSRNME